jgi:hypothetical protein
MIHEIKINDNPPSFRVALGLFQSIVEAKEYIKKEATLFQAQDHMVMEIK